MNKLLLTIIISICFNIYNIFPQSISNPIEGIKLIISTDKKSYIEGEKIWEEVILIIDKKIKLDYRPCLVNNIDLPQNLKNSHNQSVPYTGGIYDCFFPKEYPDTICHLSEMEFGYSLNPPNTRYFIFSYSLYEDEYELSANAIVSVNGKKYNIKAEPYIFTVHKPEGDELLAREAFLDFYQFIYYKDTVDKKIIAEKYEDFINKFPNSVYENRVSDIARVYFEEFNNINCEESNKYYFDKIMENPNSASNFNRLRSIINCYKQKNDAIGLLNLMNYLELRLTEETYLKKILFYIRKYYDI